MNEIARIKAKEEKKKLDSEVRINQTIVLKLFSSVFFPLLMSF